MPQRLRGYNYSLPGFYFVTICTQQHRLAFSTIVDGQLSMRKQGHIAESVLVSLPKRYEHVKLDAYVFMPNHLHAILALTAPPLEPAQHAIPRESLFEIVRVLKALTTHQIRYSEGNPWFAWQDKYYDSVIRTEDALRQIRQYIFDNPLHWSEDKLYKRY